MRKFIHAGNVRCIMSFTFLVLAKSIKYPRGQPLRLVYLSLLSNTMTRTIIICYDHSPPARNAIKWVISKKLLLSDDSVILATALDEDVVAIEGGALAIPNVVGGAGDFFAVDYAERVQRMEKDAEYELKEAVEQIEQHVVRGDALELMVCNMP